MTPDLRSLGIDDQTSLKDAPWDYELLYLPMQSAQGVWELTLDADEEVALKADKRRTRLPRRIVVGGANDIPSHAVCAFTNSRLDPPQDKNSILQVYDKWIEFLMRRRELKKQVGLSLFFEQLPIAATQWRQVNNNKPSYVSELIARDGDATVVENGMPNHAKAITLWRHIKLSEFLQNVVQKNPNHDVIYYQKCTYGDPFFAYLSAVNPQAQAFQAQYLLRQIIEMALCRVVIIDERIARTVAAKTDPRQLDTSLAHILAWMGIWVVGSVEFKTDGLKIDPIYVGTAPTQENGLVKMIVNYNEDDFHITIEYPADMRSFPEPPSQIEILTIHQTILAGKFEKHLQPILGREQWKENTPKLDIITTTL